jgi:hypothetical protein
MKYQTHYGTGLSFFYQRQKEIRRKVVVLGRMDDRKAMTAISST